MSDLFFAIHRDLPREGPGDEASTLRALRSITDAAAPQRILDVGCGPGLQTLALAAAAGARIVALDLHRAYLDQLRARAAGERRGGPIDLVQGSMFDIPLRAGSVDAIWAEGSIYIVGFERGLREWGRVLRRGGSVAVTHLSWLVAEPPQEPHAYWAAHFPDMATVDANLAAAKRSGYEAIDHFTLPERAWWDDYYDPLEQRLAQLRVEHRADADAVAAIARTQQQIDLRRRFADCYGYVFYILRLREAA